MNYNKEMPPKRARMIMNTCKNKGYELHHNDDDETFMYSCPQRGQLTTWNCLTYTLNLIWDTDLRVHPKEEK
jgi:hypothetical protein